MYEYLKAFSSPFLVKESKGSTDLHITEGDSDD